MFTKTGLKPRDSRRSALGGEFSSIPKLPPISAPSVAPTRDPRGNGGGSSAKVTARMLRARRERAKSPFAATTAVGKSEGTSASGRRQDQRQPTVPGKGKAGRVPVRPTRGTSRGREKQRGGERGGRGGGGAADASTRPIRRKRPEWDDSLGDPSQYKLTPEEAMTRKMSLVSKHNTFAFGLGSDSCDRIGDAYAGLAGFSEKTQTPKTAAGPLSVQAARARSARRVGERARKVVADGKQHSHRRSRSEGGILTPRGGKSAISSPTPSDGGGGDLTVSGKEDVCHGTASPNDLTMALYAVRDNNDSQTMEDCDGPPAASVGRAGRARFGSGGSGADRNGIDGSGGGGGGGGGGDSVVSGLAGIEVGIKAFSKRVSRLEAGRKARLEAGEHEAMDGERGARRRHGRMEERGGEVRLKVGSGGTGEEHDTETDWRRTRRRGVEATSEKEEDCCHLSDAIRHGSDHPKDVEVGGDLCQTPVRTIAAAVAEDDDDEDNSVECGRKGHRSENTRGLGEPSLTQPRGGGEVEARMSAHGSMKTIGLVERIQVLEKQVAQACLAAPPHVQPMARGKTPGRRTAEGDDFLADDTGRGGQDSSALEQSAESMQVVIADLLSLTGLLLERATVAEGRLAELSGGGAPKGVECDSESYDGASADTDLYEKARLVRARAEVIIAAGDGNRPQEERDDKGIPVDAGQNDSVSRVSGGGGGGGGGGGDGDESDPCPSLRERSQSCSSFVEATQYFRAGQSLAKVGPSPSFHAKMAAPRRMAEDCWGEALDTVGRLVESRRDDCDEVEIAVTPTPRTVSTVSTQPPSSFRGSPRPVAPSAYPILPLLPATVTNPTAATTTTAAAEAAHSLRKQVQPPPPPQPCVGGGVTHRWGERDALAPLPIAGLSLADEMDGCGPSFDFSAISAFEDNEEDAHALPVSLTPTPTKKPMHPFQRTTAPVRSPHARRQQGDGGGSDSAQAFTVRDGGGSSGNSRTSDYAPVFTVGGGGGGGNRGTSDYTAAFSETGGGDVNRSGNARVRDDGGGGLESPAIGQWYTPASARGRES